MLYIVLAYFIINVLGGLLLFLIFKEEFSIKLLIAFAFYLLPGAIIIFVMDYWKDILRFLMCMGIYITLITPAILLINPNNASPLFVGAFLIVLIQILVFSTFVVVWSNDWYLKKFGSQMY